uniref:Predicted gene, 21834 n=1 Tax=Mus spicilegus TaxID=10103 RepID=A0A8C6HZ18_MUSSI
MVQAPSPVHSNVCLLLIEFHSTCDRATRGQLTEPKKAIKYWTVLTNVESLHLLAVFRQIIRANRTQEFKVLITVVLAHLLSFGFVKTIDFHFVVETTVEQQIVNHMDSVRLHWVPLSIIIVSNVPLVVVTDFPLGALSLCHLAHHLDLPSV